MCEEERDREREREREREKERKREIEHQRVPDTHVEHRDGGHDDERVRDKHA